MSNYYSYRGIKANIAQKLMTMDGWKVYGYHPDNSDAMTDYWDPAYWGGVAEKNGYILCVDVYGSAKETPVYEYTTETKAVNADKIRKLKAMTMANGASAQEEYTAKKKIERLESAINEDAKEIRKIVDRIPAHMAHPKKCNWHIEKDGVYIAKGNGILQFDTEEFTEEMNLYMENIEKFKGWYARKMKASRSYLSDDDIRKEAMYRMQYLDGKIKGIKKYQSWIRKVDSMCGGMVGKGKTERYEKQIKTVYKSELKPRETSGKMEMGQHFILKTGFTQGCHKGNVYIIKEVYGDYIHAVKLNGKYTKECNGNVRGNHFRTSGVKFEGFLSKGFLAYCELETVKTPYRVEKVVKVTDKEPKATESVNAGDFTVQESMHTKTGEKIWLVKCTRELSKNEYKEVAAQIKKLGGYYSRFVHAFVFKENPTEKLNTLKEAC